MATAMKSWLDTAQASDWSDSPFFTETVELLRSVRDHDFESLAELCDDDFGIVDLDQSGGSVMVRTRTEWENWFRRLFAELTAVGASTDSEIVDYQALATWTWDSAWSSSGKASPSATPPRLFDCVATIVWKRTEAGWKEARWHVSLLSTDIPDGFPVAA